MFLNQQNKKSIILYDSNNIPSLPINLFSKQYRNCLLQKNNQHKCDTLRIGSHHQRGQIKFVRDEKHAQAQFISIQFYSDFRFDWKIEFTLSDRFQVKKRIFLSPSIKKQEKKFNQVEYPCQNHWDASKWCFLDINIKSFERAFDCFEYWCLQTFSISGNCQIRKVTAVENIDQMKKKEHEMHQHHKIYYEQKQDYTKLQNSEVSTVNQSKVIYESLSLPKIDNKLPAINTKSRKQSLKIRLPKIESQKIKHLQGFQQNARQHEGVSTQRSDYEKNKIFKIPKNRNIISQSCKTIRKQGGGSKKMIFFQLKEIQRKSNGFNKENIAVKSNVISIEEKEKQVQRIKNRISPFFFNNQNSSKKIGAISSRPKVLEDQIEEILQIQNSEISIETEKIAKPELITFFKNSYKRSQEGNSINQEKKSSINQSKRQKINSYEGFGQDKISNCLNLANRPYSPPFQNTISQFKHMHSEKRSEKQQLELVFDPTLNCFYSQDLDNFYSLK